MSLIITVEYEKDMPDTKEVPMPACVIAKIDNTQTGAFSTVTLRPGEKVMHKLRIDPQGVIDLRFTATEPP